MPVTIGAFTVDRVDDMLKPATGVFRIPDPPNPDIIDASNAKAVISRIPSTKKVASMALAAAECAAYRSVIGGFVTFSGLSCFVYFVTATPIPHDDGAIVEAQWDLVAPLGWAP